MMQESQINPEAHQGESRVEIIGFPDWIQFGTSRIDTIARLLEIGQLTIRADRAVRWHDDTCELAEYERAHAFACRSLSEGDAEITVYLKNLGINGGEITLSQQTRQQICEEIDRLLTKSLMRLARNYLIEVNASWPYRAIEGFTFGFEVLYVFLLLVTLANLSSEMLSGWPASDFFAKTNVETVAKEYGFYLLGVFILSNLPVLIEKSIGALAKKSHRLARIDLPNQSFHQPRLLPNVPLDRYIQAVVQIIRDELVQYIETDGLETAEEAEE